VFELVDALMDDRDGPNVPDLLVVVLFVFGGLPRTLVTGTIAAYRAFVAELIPRDARGRFTRRR
jgi:hypothetical protein